MNKLNEGNLKMKHYYVVNGNEYGIDIESKKNFNNLNDATAYYESIVDDDFYTCIRFVDENGLESIIREYY